MRLQYRAKEGEDAIQDVDVMSCMLRCANISSSPRSSYNPAGLRGHSNHARKRTRVVHGAASAGLVRSGAAIQVQWSSAILPVQVVCGFYEYEVIQYDLKKVKWGALSNISKLF
jgi:hypothetical protein